MPDPYGIYRWATQRPELQWPPQVPEGGLLGPISPLSPESQWQVPPLIRDAAYPLGAGMDVIQRGAPEQAKFLRQLLFTGFKPDAPMIGREEVGYRAALGMGSPHFGTPPGAVEGLFGVTPPEREKQARERITSVSGGVLPPLPDTPVWQDIDAPSFAQALGRLKEPEQVAGPTRGEQLTRVLGGAAAGALPGLGREYLGSGTAAVLAGAGAGSGAVVGQLQREEQARQVEFRNRQERYQARAAELEAAAAQAKGQTERFNAMGKRWEETVRYQTDLLDMQRRAPTVQVTGPGTVMVKSVNPETDEVTWQHVDFLEDFRWASLLTKQRAAAAKNKIWLGGDLEIEQASIAPELIPLIFEAQKRLSLDEKFRAMIHQRVEDETQLDMATLAAQVVSDTGPSFDHMQQVFMNEALKAMGTSLEQIMQETGQPGAQGVQLPEEF